MNLSTSPQSGTNVPIINLDGPENFVGYDVQNPFARICCRTRKLTPTMCDGTCGDCKKSRESYLITEPNRMITEATLISGGDPDSDIPAKEDATSILLRRLAEIDRWKRMFFTRKNGEIRRAMREVEQFQPTFH